LPLTDEVSTPVSQHSQRIRIAALWGFLIVLFVVGVSLTPIFHSTTPQSQFADEVDPLQHDFDSDAVRLLTTAADWDASLKSGQAILFVNCDWHITVVGFRQQFSAFADWCNSHTAYITVSAKVDPDAEDVIWGKLQTLWKTNSISQGGIRDYGGAGRVVWFDDGSVVDHAWCHDLFTPGTIEARTRKLFE
jgi:hypothetical protein